MTIEKIEILVDQSMILFVDGGAQPNPGNIGWGIHGYLYENIVPKKGSGNPTHYPTNQGYLLKTDRDKLKVQEIKPISYIDGYGSSLIPATNNVAEIQAMAYAFRKAKDFVIKEITIFTDSEYVRKGLLEWSHFWLKRNWVKTDGQVVPNASDWKLLLQEHKELVDRGVKINVYWVKGHNNNLGNEMADQLASVGVLQSKSQISVVEIKTTTAEGYWKSETERHPFMSNRRMYFNTEPTSLVAGEYYMGEHGKEDDMLGKKVSDGAMSVIQLKEPDDIVETLRNYQSSISAGLDSIVMARMDKLYSPTIYKQVNDFGRASFIRPSIYSLDLNCLDKEPLTRELRPPKLAMRAVQSLIVLKQILDSYKSKGSNFESIDLTDTIYLQEVVNKKDKQTITTKLKPEYNVGFSCLKVPFIPTDEGSIKDIVITVTLGIDLLDRNALKRLESMSPKVTLIVWKEAPEVLRYATVIESLDSFGIWAGVYSNFIFLKPK